ncbi:MAG: nucleoside triphosphate pyrophosphohydrolase [Blastocatellia bacterium]
MAVRQRMNQTKSLEDLIELMARLRAPAGCPWDREQTFATLAPMLIEEAYEAIEAAEARNWPDLRDELGDLLFQIVFYGQVGAENGWFDLPQSITRVHEKMVRRHPHVFGAEKVESTAEVLVNWEAIKAGERRAAGLDEKKQSSLLDGVSKKVPALLEAHQLTAKAARVGFDWPDIEEVFTKLSEELQELRAEISADKRDPEAIAEEVGDLLFVAANIARQLGVEPEIALKAANRKFRRRFQYVESRLAEQGKSCAESSLAEMDTYWNEIRQSEKQKGER